jgi:hypothetical protein
MTSKTGPTGFGGSSGPSFPHPLVGEEPAPLSILIGTGNPAPCSPERQDPLGQGTPWGKSQNDWQSTGRTYANEANVRPIAIKRIIPRTMYDFESFITISIQAFSYHSPAELTNQTADDRKKSGR